MKAVCARCGGGRSRHDQVCPSCGHRPQGDGLLVAWLLSDAHLDAERLEHVSQQIQDGQEVQPSERQLEKARKALGQVLSSDPGLTSRDWAALAVASLVLTPLVSWVCWWWWRRQRPRASLQALATAIPGTALFTLGPVLWHLFTVFG